MSCKLYPEIRDNEGNLVESELYKQLLSYTKDRELTNLIYAMTTSPFMDTNISQTETEKEVPNELNNLMQQNISKDSYDYQQWQANEEESQEGPIATDMMYQLEPTFEEVKDKFKLDALVSDEAKTSQYEKTLNSGVTDMNISDIIDRIDNFNSKENGYVALLNKTPQGNSIRVEVQNNQNSEQASKLTAANELNKYLIKLLNSWGIGVDNNVAVHGIFDPSNAYTTAEGLKVLLSIANDETGVNALPEEFSHFFIEALGEDPLVKRLLNLVASEGAIKYILKDEYDTYMKLYKGDFNKMVKESAGKLLADYLKGKETPEVSQSLLNRIWNKVKSIFKGKSSADIDYAIREANVIASKLSNSIKTEEMGNKINTQLASKGPTLYHTDATIEYLKTQVESIIKNKMAHYQVYSKRKKGKAFSEKEELEYAALKEAMKKGEYLQGIVDFLYQTKALIDKSVEDLSSLYKGGTLNIGSNKDEYKAVASYLRDIHNFTSSYEEVLNSLSGMEKAVKRGQIDVDPEIAHKISTVANELVGTIGNLNEDYKDISLELMEAILRPFFGEDKVIPSGKDKGKILTLRDVLLRAPKDINYARHMIESAADSGDIGLELYDALIKDYKWIAKEATERLLHDTIAQHEVLTNSGVRNTSFMYEMDPNGVPTLFLISPIDHGKYERAREAEEQRLKDEGLSEEEIEQKLNKWIKTNTFNKRVLSSDGKSKWERWPKMDIYKSDAFSKLNKAQQDYYEYYLQKKIDLDMKYPNSSTYTFRAIQVMNESTEAVANQVGLKNKAKTIAGNIGDKIFRREDDTEFGTRQILKDFKGKEIKQLPVFYTSPLQDKSRLSLDATSALVNYGAMAYNYDAMFKLLDIIEVGRDLIRSTKVQQWAGNKKLMSKIKAFGEEIQEDYEKSGDDLRIVQRFDSLVDMQVYGNMKEDEGVFSVLGKEIDIAKVSDSLMQLTSLQTLGLNFFSGINNVAMGKMQLLLEGVAGEYFGNKNLKNAEIAYFRDVIAYAGEIGKNTNTSKLGLFIEKFDVLQEWDKEAQKKDFHKNSILKIFGNGAAFFMSSAGEHYLACKTALAYMDNNKVLLNGKEISLYDAYEQKKTIVGGKVVDAHLALKEGVTKLDGSAFTSNDEKRVSQKIASINQALNGVYSNADKSEMQRYALGRFAILYRKWMAPHYDRRFRTKYYHVQLDQDREGFYNTTANFMLQLAKEMKQGKLNIALSWSNLSVHERGNIKRAGTEIAVFFALSLLLYLMGHKDKDKQTWAGRVMEYELRRLHLELGTSWYIPMMFTEGMTVLQSPTAAMRTFGAISETIDVFDLNKPIDRGMYKGHSVYYRNAMQNIPLWGNINKLMSIKEDDNLFKYLPQF